MVQLLRGLDVHEEDSDSMSSTHWEAHCNSSTGSCAVHKHVCMYYVCYMEANTCHSTHVEVEHGVGELFSFSSKYPGPGQPTQAVGLGKKQGSTGSSGGPGTFSDY